MEDFPRQLVDLIDFLAGESTPGNVTAVPCAPEPPPMWLLRSSDYSAHVAGPIRLPFAFADHISAANTDIALERYRSSFRPSAALAEP